MSPLTIQPRDEQVAALEGVVTSLLSYCRGKGWGGYDPYDALNSRIYNSTPLRHSRVCNIVFTQLLKRLPINLRQLLLIPEVQNAKGIALFLSALIKLNRLGMASEGECRGMTQQLASLRSSEGRYWCWGYSFPWQTRSHLVPRGAPNLVCTTFAAHALLDAFERFGEGEYLEMALSAADYLVEELYWSDGEAVGFSYPLPGIRVQVHNANFLAAALLCRASTVSGDDRFLEPGLKAARHSAGSQHEDGSWDYGELGSQRWVDNFHTGYNLCALRSIGKYAGTSEFDRAVVSGYRFYLEHFFTADAAPRYFHDRSYPLDVHCVAQSIITLLQLQDVAEGSRAVADSVFQWATANLWDPQGFFYYRVRPLFTNRISYMRWSQAWMLLALATLLEQTALERLREDAAPISEKEDAGERLRPSVPTPQAARAQQ